MEHFESRSDKHDRIEEPESLEQFRRSLEQTEGVEDVRLQELGFTEDALEPYYAGLLASDGHIEPDTNRSVLASSDLEFVRSVVEPVLDEQEINYSEFWDDGAGVYKISIYDHELKETLTEKYNIPPGEKAESIEPPEGLDEDEEVWYIKGWFDGEGWSEEMIKQHDDTEYYYPRVGFKVMSEEMRDWIAQELEERHPCLHLRS